MRNNHSAPVPTPFTISITCTAEACTLVGQQGQMAQQFTLALDDAESIAKLMLEKCAAARSPILVASNVPGLKSS